MLSQRLISLEIGESLTLKSTQDWLAYSSQSGKQAWLSANTGEIAFGKAPPSTMTEKELSPRNLRKAGVPVRTLEDGFLLNLQEVYKTAASEIALHVEDNTKLGEITAKLQEELTDEADKYVWKIYTAGVASESPGDKTVPLDGSDIRATQWVWNNKNGLGQAIKGFATKQLRTIQEAMERHIAAEQPFDLPDLVKMLRPIVVKGRNDLERIARTESSRIVNVSRAMTWEKIADPTKEEFHWIVAKHPKGDKRTCEICLAIANGGTVLFEKAMTEFPGNPYNLGSLKRLVPHLIAHPNERCVIVRKPESILGKSWKIGPFAGPNGGEYWLTEGPDLIESAWTKEYRPIKEKGIVIAKYRVYKEPKNKAGWKGPIRGPKGGIYWERGQERRRQEVEPAWKPEDVVLDGSREHEWEGENLRSGRIQFKGQEAGDYSYVFQSKNVSSLTDPPTHVFIGAIKIHQEFRQRGIGTEILKRIENEAMERGLDKIKAAASWDGIVVWPLLGFEWDEKDEIVQLLQDYSDYWGHDWQINTEMSSKEIVLANPEIARALIQIGWVRGDAFDFYERWAESPEPDPDMSWRERMRFRLANSRAIGFYITKHLDHLKSKADLPEWAQAIIDRDLWFAEEKEEELTEKIWVPMKQMPQDWRGPMTGPRGAKYMISPKGKHVYNPSKWPKKVVMGWMDTDTGNFIPGKDRPGVRAGPQYTPDISERRQGLNEIKDIGLKTHLEQYKWIPGIYNPTNDRVWMQDHSRTHDDLYANFGNDSVGWGPNLHYFVIKVGQSHPIWGEGSRRSILETAFSQRLKLMDDMIVAFDAGPGGDQGQYTWDQMYDAAEAMKKEFPEIAGFTYLDSTKGSWRTISLKPKPKVVVASYRETVKFPLLEKGWTRYRGPKGGKGWKSDVTGVVLYQDEKPDDKTGHFEGVFQAPDQAIAAAEKFGPGTKITKIPQGYKVERGRPEPKTSPLTGTVEEGQQTLAGRDVSEVFFPSTPTREHLGELEQMPGEQQTLEGEGARLPSSGRGRKLAGELADMIGGVMDFDEPTEQPREFYECYDGTGLWAALFDCTNEKTVDAVQDKFVETLEAYGMDNKVALEFIEHLASWTRGQVSQLREMVETGHDLHRNNRREDLKILQKFYHDYMGMGEKRMLYRGMGVRVEDEWVDSLKVGDSAKLFMNPADSWTEDSIGDTADEFATVMGSGEGRFPNGIVLEAEMPREDILIGYPFVGFGSEEENIVMARDYDWKVTNIDMRGMDWGDTGKEGAPVVITIERQPMGEKANVAIFDLTGDNDWAGTRRLVKKEALGTGTAGVINPVYSKPKKRKKVKGKEADAGPSGGSAIKIVDYIKRAAEDWVPYKGPRGGTGFRNTKTGYIWYGDKPPSDKQHKTALETRHRQNRRIGVLDRIGSIVPHIPGGQGKKKFVKPLANILAIQNNTKRAYSMLAFAQRGGLISQDELDESAAKLGISERRRKRLEAKLDHDFKKYMPTFKPTKTSPERILKDIKEEGGITINVGTGKRPTSGFAVADVPGAEKIYDTKTFHMKHIQAYLKEHPELMKSKDLHFGAWEDEKTGKTYLDTPRVYKSREEAIEAGLKANQISIWDFEAGKEIRLKAEVQKPEPTPAQREATRKRKAYWKDPAKERERKRRAYKARRERAKPKFGVTADPYGQKSVLLWKQGGWRGPIRGSRGGQFMLRPDGTPEYDQSKWPTSEKPQEKAELQALEQLEQIDVLYYGWDARPEDYLNDEIENMVPIGTGTDIKDLNAGLENYYGDEEGWKIESWFGVDRMDIPIDSLVSSQRALTRQLVKDGITYFDRIPPGSVYQVGDVFWIHNGNHRVAAAKLLGKTSITMKVIDLTPEQKYEQPPEDQYESYLQYLSDLQSSLSSEPAEQMKELSDYMVENYPEVAKELIVQTRIAAHIGPLKVVGIASPNEKSVKGIWYHGTSKKNADKIMKEGIIKPSQDTKYNLDIPRFDAVYITKNLETAQHYAEREGVVLKVRVEDTGNLVPDEDTITEAFQEETDPLHEKVKAVWWDSYKKEQANLEDAYPWLAEQKSVIINSWMEWHNKYDRIPEFPPSQGIQKGWQGPFRGPQGGKFWTNPKRVDATGKPDKVYQSEKPEPQYKPQDDPLYQRALKMKTKVPFDKRLKLLKMGVDRFPPMDASNIKVRLRFKPKKEPAMTWRDSKGRAQAAYTKVFLEANAAKKWTRVMKYDAKLEFQQRRLQNLVGRTKFGTPENQAAVIASVISLTGLRVGGAVAAKSRHFGVSTLRGTHVKALKNGGVALTFTGKSGVKINQHIPPGKTAKALLRYAGKAKHLPMFSIGPHKPRALLPGKMKLKDFRTILATRWAKEELEKEFAEYIKHDYRWSKPEQIKKMIMAASKRVAKKLHNTPSVARGSYIHPEVIEEFIEKIND